MQHPPHHEPESPVAFNTDVADNNRLASGIPPVLWVIILPSLFVFVLSRMGILNMRLGLIPAELFAVSGSAFNAEFFYLFTYVFMHGSIMHLLFNMLWLVIFGSVVARRLMAIGPVWRPSAWQGITLFLVFFWMSGAISAIGYALLDKASFTILIGASGAISAMMGAAIRIGLQRHQPHGPFSGRLLPLTGRDFLTFSAIYITVNMLPLIGGSVVDVFSIGGSQAMIAWEAHIIGYLFGALVIPVVDRMALRARLDYIGRTDQPQPMRKQNP